MSNEILGICLISCAWAFILGAALGLELGKRSRRRNRAFDPVTTEELTKIVNKIYAQGRLHNG